MIHFFFLLPSDFLSPINDKVEHSQPTRHSKDDKEQSNIELDEDDENNFPK
jgi:hypothetical protein